MYVPDEFGVSGVGVIQLLIKKYLHLRFQVHYVAAGGFQRHALQGGFGSLDENTETNTNKVYIDVSLGIQLI